MRLFVALPVPAEVEDELWPLQDGVPGADWTEPGAHHVTLAFLGEVEPGRLPQLAEVLGRFRWRALDLQLHEVGFFPPRGAPRVLWAGVVDSAAVTVVHERLARHLDDAGFSTDRRHFKPHTTLARLHRAPSHRVAEWLGGQVGFRSPAWQAAELALYQSKQGPGLSEYLILERFPAR